MANDITSNPWVLDTTTSSPLLPSSNVYVSHFEFVGYTNSTDICQIKNAAGLVVWQGQGSTDLQPDHSGRIGTVHSGLYLSRLDSGVVRVFLGKPE